MAHGDGVAQHLDAEFPEQAFGNSAGRHSRGGFAGGGALEHVARIVKIEFLRAGQIGVARARRREAALRVFRAFAIFDRQRLFPVLPVAIFQAHRDGRADGLAVAHAGEEYPPDPSRCAGAPPRPKPNWRRWSSRPTNSRSTGTPAGRPESQAIRAWPWDSPAVTNRSMFSWAS